jgi:hypothetical protein
LQTPCSHFSLYYKAIIKTAIPDSSKIKPEASKIKSDASNIKPNVSKIKPDASKIKLNASKKSGARAK